MTLLVKIEDSALQSWLTLRLFAAILLLLMLTLCNCSVWPLLEFSPRDKMSVLQMQDVFATVLANREYAFPEKKKERWITQKLHQCSNNADGLFNRHLQDSADIKLHLTSKPVPMIIKSIILTFLSFLNILHINQRKMSFPQWCPFYLHMFFFWLVFKGSYFSERVAKFRKRSLEKAYQYATYRFMLSTSLNLVVYPDWILDWRTHLTSLRKDHVTFNTFRFFKTAFIAAHFCDSSFLEELFEPKFWKSEKLKRENLPQQFQMTFSDDFFSNKNQAVHFENFKIAWKWSVPFRKWSEENQWNNQ